MGQPHPWGWIWRLALLVPTLTEAQGFPHLSLNYFVQIYLCLDQDENEKLAAKMYLAEGAKESQFLSFLSLEVIGGRLRSVQGLFR